VVQRRIDPLLVTANQLIVGGHVSLAGPVDQQLLLNRGGSLGVAGSSGPWLAAADCSVIIIGGSSGATFQRISLVREVLRQAQQARRPFEAGRVRKTWRACSRYGERFSSEQPACRIGPVTPFTESSNWLSRPEPVLDARAVAASARSQTTSTGKVNLLWRGRFPSDLPPPPPIQKGQRNRHKPISRPEREAKLA